MSMALYDEVKNGRIGSYVFVERMDGVDAGKSLKEAAALAVAQKKKLFGLFGGPEGHFEPPVPTDNGSATLTRATIENPLLKDATRAALKVLSKNKNGFFLLVEQGDIDLANHANDYRWMIGAMWDLDEAVRAAVEFVDRPGDDITWANTLLIVTSDHVTGSMRLNDGKRPGQGAPSRAVAGPLPRQAVMVRRLPGGRGELQCHRPPQRARIALRHGGQQPDEAPAAVRGQLVPLHAHPRQHAALPRHDQRRGHPPALSPQGHRHPSHLLPGRAIAGWEVKSLTS